MLPAIGLIIAVVIGIGVAIAVAVAKRGGTLGGVDPDSYPFSAP